MWVMAVVLGLSAVSATAQTTRPSVDDWPQFRGPNRNGITTEADWSPQWPAAGPARLWSAQVGIGFSSVAVRAYPNNPAQRYVMMAQTR